MKISCWNVNGIRACIKKGFWDWYKKSKSNIVCLQETKITKSDFQKIAEEFNLVPLVESENDLPLFPTSKPKPKSPLYYALATAQKPGYSGVLILTKTKPKNIQIGLGIDKFDNEGRTLIADYGKFILANTYMPNSSRDLSRTPFKLEYCNALLKELQKYRKKQKNIIICGDMNVAHTEIDIKNPKTNVNNAGFTPIEREWFTKFLSHKYIDTFRHQNPDARDMYTWWSYRPGVRLKNIGWRIDYFVVTQEMMKNVKKTSIQMEQMGSDHCPIHLVLE